MSYCRPGLDSDIYVFLNIEGYFECQMCDLDDDDGSWTQDPSEMLHHMKAHVAYGHRVPDYAIEAMREESTKKERGDG